MKFTICLLLALSGYAIAEPPPPFPFPLTNNGLSVVRPPFIIQPINSNGQIRVVPEGQSDLFRDVPFTPITTLRERQPSNYKPTKRPSNKPISGGYADFNNSPSLVVPSKKRPQQPKRRLNNLLIITNEEINNRNNFPTLSLSPPSRRQNRRRPLSGSRRPSSSRSNPSSPVILLQLVRPSRIPSTRNSAQFSPQPQFQPFFG